MAQRNPMNDRYQGDGPGGQTRKSAARAKPVTQAASSVHIKKKPQTAAEKRTARKAREKEAERKAREKALRKTEREKAEAAAAAGGAGGAGGTTGGGAKPTEQPKGLLGKLFAPNPQAPATEEYRKWRRLYWILVLAGVGFLIVSFLTQGYLAASPSWMIVLGGAYVCIIAAFVVDFRKVKPLMKEHQKQGTGNKSPKQLKHEKEAAERAAAIEAARKAAKGAKRLPRRKKKDGDTIVPGEEQ